MRMGAGHLGVLAASDFIAHFDRGDLVGVVYRSDYEVMYGCDVFVVWCEVVFDCGGRVVVGLRYGIDEPGGPEVVITGCMERARLAAMARMNEFLGMYDVEF